MTPFPNHHPLELDHEGTRLIDICVKGESVSEWLADGLWEQAEQYIHERYAPELSESARKIVERMDRRDILKERMR